MKLGTVFFLITILTLATLYAYTDSERQDAICSGDMGTVMRIFSSKSEIDQKAKGGYSLSVAAYCYGGRPAVVRYFLDKGAELNHPDETGYNAVMWAIRSFHRPLESDQMREQVFRMINMGADVNHQCATTGRTALMGAAELGDRGLVDLLLSKGASKTPRTKADWCISGNYSAQCSAADYARLGGFVDLAIELDGGNPDTYKTQLNYAIRTGNRPEAERLIASGADVNMKETLSNLTPLHYAVFANDAEIVRSLIRAGANPNVQSYAGTTPLREAVVRYEREAARALIDGGAKANNAQRQGCGGGLDEFGWAAEYNQRDIAEYMINHGAIDIQNPGRVFQELYGRHDWNIEVVRLLLDKGARPTMTDIDTLRTIKARNAWLQHADDIIALLETYIPNGTPTVNMHAQKSVRVGSAGNRKGGGSEYHILNKKNGPVNPSNSRDPF
ncbi:MAG: ankyrin repeat domain-containing protein [Spirochaetes bacterium]|nr:ankyrin repeat domain-containing protein [Spirochaetota bacterium]